MRWALLWLAALGAQPLGALSREMYCGDDDCFAVLGLERWASPSSAEIRAAYRALSKQLHPDKNRKDPEGASARFAKVAVAYEILVDEATREDYLYYLDHPEERLANMVRFYKPQSSPAVVVSAAVVLLTALQWTLQWLAWQRGRSYVRKYHPVFAKMVAAEVARRTSSPPGGSSIGSSNGSSIGSSTGSSIGSSIGSSGTSGSVSSGGKRGKRGKEAARDKDAARDEALRIEREVADELIDTVDLGGEYAKPRLEGLLVVRLVKLPLALPRAAWAWLDFYWRHTVRGLPLSEQEELELLSRALGVSEREMLSQVPPAELLLMREARVWESRAHMLAFQEAKLRQENPERYKRYVRFKNK
jgi:DnaJ family protein C protein 25